MNSVKMRVSASDFLLVPRSLFDSSKAFGFDRDVVIYEPSAICDVKITVYSRSGEEVRFSADAACCAAKLWLDQNDSHDKYVTVETAVGIFEAKCRRQYGCVYEVELNVGRAKLKAENSQKKLLRFYPINLGRETFDITAVFLDIPHVVLFIGDSVEDLDIDLFVKRFEWQALFSTEPQFSFVSPLGGDSLAIRSMYKERELSSCGNASCATVAAAAICGIVDFDTYIKAEFQSGTLTVLCNRDIELILKCSPTYVNTDSL